MKISAKVIAAPLIKGTVKLSLILYEKSSIVGAVIPPTTKVIKGKPRAMYRKNPHSNTEPIYANVPSKVRFLNNLFLPYANLKILEKRSPKIRNVSPIIAILFSNKKIVINAARRNKVIEENFVNSLFLKIKFIFSEGKLFFFLLNSLYKSNPRKQTKTIPIINSVINCEL